MDITVPPSTINTVSTTLPATADGARMARAFVSEALRIWGLEEVAGDVVSVASELVINVIVHTEGRPVLELQVCADRIRIEVRDASPVLPVVGSHDARGAWGLTTVEQMSLDWGFHRETEGKVVWSELAIPDAAITDDRWV